MPDENRRDAEVNREFHPGRFCGLEPIVRMRFGVQTEVDRAFAQSLGYGVHVEMHHHAKQINIVSQQVSICVLKNGAGQEKIMNKQTLHQLMPPSPEEEKPAIRLKLTN